MTSFPLVPRAGQVNLNIGTSSTGDDARTLEVPFGTLDSSGFPQAIKLSIESSSDITIPETNITCQAFQDAKGTVTLGPMFTDSTTANLGSSPVEIGSIFCSDAKDVQARLNGVGSSHAASSLVTATNSGHPSAVALPKSSATQTSPASNSVTPIQSAGNTKPKTSHQFSTATLTTAAGITSATAASNAAVMLPSIAPPGTSQAADTPSTASESVASTESDSAAAQPTTNGATTAYVDGNLTLKKILGLAFLITCYLRLFDV
ncbi:MAG: hypothetical protein Q9191_002201 [Dirinaria sp. TL-2023a]